MFEARQRVIAQARAWKPGQDALGSASGATHPEPSKKAVPIEDLLRWAYREELPKIQADNYAVAVGFGHAWGSVEAYAQYGARVDEADFNRWGVVPDRMATRSPHPDALAIGNAVLDLDGLILDLPPDWAPLSDLGDMGGHGPRVIAESLERLTVIDAGGACRMKLDLRRLVFRHAILGGCPVYEADAPEIKVETGANGRPKWFIRRDIMQPTADGGEAPVSVECDGWSRSAHRPLIGAYQKTYLDPNPVDAAVARAEYEIWRAALDVLVMDLTGAMAAHVALPSPRPKRPWEEAAPAVGTVLRDLTEVAPRRARPSQKRKGIIRSP